MLPQDFDLADLAVLGNLKEEIINEKSFISCELTQKQFAFLLGYLLEHFKGADPYGLIGSFSRDPWLAAYYFDKNDFSALNSDQGNQANGLTLSSSELFISSNNSVNKKEEKKREWVLNFSCKTILRIKTSDDSDEKEGRQQTKFFVLIPEGRFIKGGRHYSCLKVVKSDLPFIPKNKRGSDKFSPVVCKINYIFSGKTKEDFLDLLKDQWQKVFLKINEGLETQEDGFQQSEE